MDSMPSDGPTLLALCVWRESRNQPYQAILGVACSIMNRTKVPGWWNHRTAGDIASVVLAPWQYTSMTGHGDPQLNLFPVDETSTAWQQSLQAASDAIGGAGDPTGGADSYYDRSLDSHPPFWAKPPAQHLVDLGALRFWRVF